MMKKPGLRSGILILHPCRKVTGGIQGVGGIPLPPRIVCLVLESSFQRSSGWRHWTNRTLSGNKSTKKSDAKVAIFNFLFISVSDEGCASDFKSSGKDLTIPENNLSVPG
jgi:hypothetical protein